jgi:hypothetical protein
VCYFLHIASPLTLSEVRSMLPSGLVAHLVSTVERDALIRLLPDARTVAQLVVGSCSCDLIVPRQADPQEDERHLRAGYRRLNLPRDAVIRALERHRRPLPRPRQPPAGWPRALAAFVAEHARNAGPTLYYLSFRPDPVAGPQAQDRPPETRSVEEVRAKPGGWIGTGETVVVR